MKRRLLLGISGMILCLVMLVSSCAVRGNTVSRTEDAVLANGNLQRTRPEGDVVRCDGEFLFSMYNSWEGNYALQYYDPAGGEVHPFCTAPNCLHKGRYCATNGATENLEFADGEVYALTLNLWPEGSRIMKLRGDRFVPVFAGEDGDAFYSIGGVAHFFHYGGDLYAATNDGKLVLFAGGGPQPKTLLEDYQGFAEIVLGKYLYYRSNGKETGFFRIDLSAASPAAERILEETQCVTDGKHIYYTRMHDKDADGYCWLYRCAMDGSDEELLLRRKVLASSLNFDGEYLYFRLFTDLYEMGEDSCEIYRMRKSDPADVEMLAELSDPVSSIYLLPNDESLFVRTYGVGQYGLAETGVTVVSKDGQTVRPLSITLAGAPVVAAPSDGENKTAVFFVLAAALLLSAMTVFFVYLYRHRARAPKYAAEASHAALDEDAWPSYYRKLESQYDDQRVLIHDMNRHLEMIDALAESGDSAAVHRYVARLTESPALTRRLRFCADPTLNILLTKYAEISKEKGIRFTADVRHAPLHVLSPEETTALFGNLLDNAVEAAENAEAPFIELRFGEPTGAGAVLSVVNACREPPAVSASGALLSRKPGEGHGLGLKSVRAVVRKYGGTLRQTYDAENKAFHTSVLLRPEA